MAVMPRHTRPRPALSPELEIAADAFGSRESLAILALLAMNSQVTVPVICEALDMAANTVSRHLAALEGHQLVHASQPAGSRRGKTVTYGADGLAIRHWLDEVRATLAPARSRGRK